MGTQVFVVKKISDNANTGMVCLWAYESKICDHLGEFAVKNKTKQKQKNISDNAGTGMVCLWVFMSLRHVIIHVKLR